VSDKVVVCEREPEVAVMVTVEVPVGVGGGFVAALFPPHPVRESPTSKRSNDPLPTAMDLRSFLRLRIMGNMAANPNGRMTPAAIVDVKGARFGRDAMYGFGGGGPEEVPAVMVRVVLALAPGAGVIELGEN
jgi:hypothetical protein